MNTDSLRDWLGNPRAGRSGTTMHPVHLDAGEWTDLVADLGLEARGTDPIVSRALGQRNTHLRNLNAEE